MYFIDYVIFRGISGDFPLPVLLHLHLDKITISIAHEPGLVFRSCTGCHQDGMYCSCCRRAPAQPWCCCSHRDIAHRLIVVGDLFAGLGVVEVDLLVSLGVVEVNPLLKVLVAPLVLDLCLAMLGEMI